MADAATNRTDRSSRIAEQVQAIEAEFSVAMGSAERVAAACDRLAAIRSEEREPEDHEALVALAALLSRRGGAVASTLFDFLDAAAGEDEEPWPIIEGLLGARDRTLQRRALARAAASGPAITDTVVEFLGRWLDANEALAGDAGTLELLRKVLAGTSREEAGSPEEAVVRLLLTSANWSARRLAARLLDAEEEPAPPDLARQVLGDKAFNFLEGYLAFTRASHEDLLVLTGPNRQVAGLDSLRAAEAQLGRALLADVIGEVGWDRVSCGLIVDRHVGISLAGGFPLTARPAEATLLKGHEQSHQVFDRCLIVAVGGAAAQDQRPVEGDDPVDRFRSYNLAHAAALADIVDIAPLSRAKIARILEHLDKIVEDFVTLFSGHEPECADLPELYHGLKQRVTDEVARIEEDHHISAELTRLVQMFEDPLCLGEVRTLHGLKRYLHQKGLRLGFRLFEAGRATNRTVDLVVTAEGRILSHTSPIRYVDLEAAGGTDCGGPQQLTYPVWVAARQFGRQMIHGVTSIPNVDIFCYGNEVHYYLRYRNHPAFLRIDFSPPTAGGMADLEYYGVSKFELAEHPDLELNAIRLLFRKLDYHIEIRDTRIHARYDKERAADLADLCDKVEALFALAPYLMEVDWVIGGLDLSAEACGLVAEAWADFFAQWQVLPVSQMLTEDRRSVLAAVETGYDGRREVGWNGREPYHDRFLVEAPPDLPATLRAALDERDLGFIPLPESDSARLGVQTGFDRVVIRPLREAVARGEIMERGTRLKACPPDLFERQHEAERLAALLADDAAELADACRMAGTAAALERGLRFTTTGAVNGYEVQQARLVLRGGALELYVLRDAGGMIRLAFYASGGCLYRWRISEAQPWQDNARFDVAALTRVLRQNNYLAVGMEPRAEADPEELAALRRLVASANPSGAAPPIPGDRLIGGLAASPGRAVGPVIFKGVDRKAEEVEGSILFAATVGPEDNALLYRAAGIVSTGGGVLSHAGLLAVQFGKPALIISGRWRCEPDREPGLLYDLVEYKQHSRPFGDYVATRHDRVRQAEECLREGELVVLDADRGLLRVLGRDPDARALHRNLQQLAEAGSALARAGHDDELLALRGRRLQARHQLERLLARLQAPVLAGHAVRALLFGERSPGAGGQSAERARLLEALLKNQVVAEAVRQNISGVVAELSQRFRGRVGEAERLLPTSADVYEVLSLRLDALRLRDLLAGVADVLNACGLDDLGIPTADLGQLESTALGRLAALRRDAEDELRRAAEQPETTPFVRHQLRRVERLSRVLAVPGPASGWFEDLDHRLTRQDADNLKRCQSCRVLRPGDGGFELHSLIGWKAANLAEMSRLGAEGLVPGWFVVTDRALGEALETPVRRGVDDLGLGGMPYPLLREAIERVLSLEQMTDAQQSARISELWDSVELPAEVSEEVLSAYHELADAGAPIEAAGGRVARLPWDAGEDPTEDPESPFVAVRSSAREEDTEAAARAGEFETFLFVRGADGLLHYLKQAWAGLWTARAIHNRRVLGTGPIAAGGGILVQRMVWSRVAGVVQTVNLAEGRLREIVVNAGLGLGLGVVSGRVAADQIVVAKEGDLKDAPLRFRYVTADKRERVVYDRRSGRGTVLSETLYHQRLRPALEYVELCDLVRAAVLLERAYGYPLDIEFGIQGPRLHLLQARPVANFGAVLTETAEKHPLG